MMESADLQQEVMRLRDRVHDHAGHIQRCLDLEERVERLESLPVSVAELKLIVDRLEKIVWGGAATVGGLLVVQLIQILTAGSK